MNKTLDPIAEFHRFPRITRFYAEHRLRSGDRHPDEHRVIAEKLDGWTARVHPELREELLAELEGVG